MMIFILNKYGLFGGSDERWSGFLQLCAEILKRCGEPDPSEARWSWFVEEWSVLMHEIQEPSNTYNQEERYAYGDRIIESAMEEWGQLPRDARTAEALIKALKDRAYRVNP